MPGRTGGAVGYTGTIDVVVTDLMMPRMSGGEFANALAVTHPALPVVFTSGYTDDACFAAEYSRRSRVLAEAVHRSNSFRTRSAACSTTTGTSRSIARAYRHHMRIDDIPRFSTISRRCTAAPVECFSVCRQT